MNIYTPMPNNTLPIYNFMILIRLLFDDTRVYALHQYVEERLYRK